ncbi:unnamed protein product [Diabrotica balteata]|uniref:Uncharacterized protein n=1 Tax=Diabrotica balteata TaxID=107213 RepID=A0A9N9X773_DIABA|nr:unnamed protein product [Diabrotica balteata]
MIKFKSDSQDPLIDKTYLYGGHSCINLMITGRTTTYVWDHHEDEGLKLLGIERQIQIGLITVMEYHRYCTVNRYTNTVALDAHLTVLLSDQRKLLVRKLKVNKPDGFLKVLILTEWSCK